MVDYNNLTSLEGSPEKVNGFFGCSHNDLTTLEGGPKVVKGQYSCSYNNLKNLKGSPDSIENYFDASYNDLRNLKGAPKAIDCYFDISGNDNLTSLEGGPEVVMTEYLMMDCINLKSLYGITHRVRKVTPPKHLQVEADFINNYEMAVLKKENYWTELLDFVIKNNKDLDGVNWPEGFITDDTRRSAKTTHKYKL